MSDFLGQGWQFPVRFDAQSKGVAMAQGVEDIRQSLMVLLSTKVGERVMRPRLGCNMEDLLFETLDVRTKAYISDLVETAIVEFEPRIDLEKVDLSGSDIYGGRVEVHVSFRVRATNSRFNLVYPLYKNESTLST